MERRRQINGLVFGETGTGKSSLINLIFDKENFSNVCNEARGCTNECLTLKGSIDNIDLTLYETVAIEESDQGTVPLQSALIQLNKLFKSIEQGIHILLFSIQLGRLTNTVDIIYDLFVNYLTNKQIPCLLIITHCECEQTIGDWWKRNQHTIQTDRFQQISQAISITTIKQTQRGINLIDLYQSSRKELIDSILKYSLEKSFDLQTRINYFFSYLKNLFEKKQNKHLNDLIESFINLNPKKDICQTKQQCFGHCIILIDNYSTTDQQIKDSHFNYQQLTNDLFDCYPTISIRSFQCQLKSILKLFPLNNRNEFEEFYNISSGSLTLVLIRHSKEFHVKSSLIKQQLKKLRNLINQLNFNINHRYFLNENPYDEIYLNLKEYNQQLNSMNINLYQLNYLKEDKQIESIGILNQSKRICLFETIQMIINKL